MPVSSDIFGTEIFARSRYALIYRNIRIPLYFTKKNQIKNTIATTDMEMLTMCQISLRSVLFFSLILLTSF